MTTIRTILWSAVLVLMACVLWLSCRAARANDGEYVHAPEPPLAALLVSILVMRRRR
jgi:hypothetical protein